MSSNPYGSPMAGGSVEPHRGTLIIILGVLSIFCCPLVGIAAILMGNGDLKKMQAGQMDRSGESNTKIGKILGIVGLVLAAIGIVINILMIVIGGGAAALNN